MILAAGRGKRMGALTDHAPKPLLTLAGMPLIEYHVRALASSGFADIVINLAWYGEHIARALGDGQRFGVRIQYSREPEGALETAGGIAKALPLLGEEPFLVINGDVWTDFPLHTLSDAASWLTAHVPLHLVMVPNPSHNLDGDFLLRRKTDSPIGHLVAKNEDGSRHTDRDVSIECCTFSGIGVYSASVFQTIQGRAALGPLMKQCISKHTVSAQYFDGYWWDVGTPDRLAAVESFLQGHSKESHSNGWRYE